MEAAEYDEEGNFIPVVPITSLKEYIDDGLIFSAPNGSNEIDFASFQSHQEELFEMQRKQMERLKCTEHEDNNFVTKSGNYLCNSSEHSSKIISCAPSVSLTQSTPFASTSTSSTLHQTLDSASVQFAVSVVRSASDFSSLMLNTNDNNSAKDTVSNSTTNNFLDSYLTEKSTGNNNNNTSNGPIDSKEFARKTNNSEMTLPPSQHDAQDSHNQNTVTSLSSCKLKYQNRSQNTSLPPTSTDVT